MEVLAEETDKTADPQQINFVSAKVTARFGGQNPTSPFFKCNRFGAGILTSMIRAW